MEERGQCVFRIGALLKAEGTGDSVGKSFNTFDFSLLAPYVPTVFSILTGYGNPATGAYRRGNLYQLVSTTALIVS